MKSLTRTRPLAMKEARISTLLRTIGVRIPMHKGGAFWDQSRTELEYLLYDAQQLYRKRIKQIAPRRLEQSGEQATHLNSIWNEIKRRFRRRLNPELPRPKSNSPRGVRLRRKRAACGAK